MKVVVTGGAGQLGTLVLRRLIDDRSVEAVRCLDVRAPIVTGRKLEFHRADVRDPELWRHLEGFDALVHLAAVRREKDPQLTRSVNVEGSRNVFEAATRTGIRRIVYGSSIAAYGVVHGHALPLREDSPRRYQPEFTYAATKHEVEAFLDEFEPRHPELSVVRLRPAVMVGRRMEHPFGDRLRGRVLIDAEGAPAPVVWDEDVADAVMLALKQEALRGAFNLSADEPLPPHEVARLASLHLVRVPRPVAVASARVLPMLARLTGLPASDPAWVRISDVPMMVSCERARKVLGWVPRAPSSRDVWKRYANSAPVRTDRRILVFFASINVAARRQMGDGLGGRESRIHLALSGPNGGDFTIDIREGRLRMHRGVPRPPTATVQMTASFFLDLLSGKFDLGAALTTGRVRVEGEDPRATAHLLMGMIETFRGKVSERTRLSARWFGAWMARHT